MLRYIMSNNTVWHKPVIIIHMCCDGLRSLAVSQRNSPVPKYNNSMLIILITSQIVNICYLFCIFNFLRNLKIHLNIFIIILYLALIPPPPPLASPCKRGLKITGKP